MPVNWTPMIQGVLGAGYTPQLNPAISTATHVDQYGNLTDDSGKIIPTYSTPSWWSRAFNPEAQQIMAANATQMAAPTIARQQAAAEANRQKALYEGQTSNLIGRANAVTGAPLTTQMGLAAIGGTDQGQVNQFFQNQARLAQGTFPATAGAETAVAQHTAAENNPAANPLIGQTALNTAALNKGVSEAQVGALPATQRNIAYDANVVQPYTAYKSVYEATHPFAGSSAFMTPVLHPETGVQSKEINPAMSFAGTMMTPYMLNSMGGVGGGTITSPSGKVINIPPPPDRLPSINQPLYGQPSSLPDSLGHKVTPVEGYEDFDADYHTGRLYYKGQDVTNDPRVADVKQAAILQGRKELQNNHEAIHNSKKANLDAKMAALKAEKAALESQRTSGFNEFANAPYGPWPTVKAIGRGARDYLWNPTVSFFETQ